MSVKAYYHDDPGAPVLDGTAGSLVQLLQKCLVDGYGDVAQGTWKDPLGWQGLYDSVFRQAAFSSTVTGGTGFWLYVDDTIGTYGIPQGYEAFGGFDGADAPTGLGQAFGGGYINKSEGGGNVSWTLYGDGQAFWLLCNATSYAAEDGAYACVGFGDYISYNATDPYRCFIVMDFDLAANQTWTYGFNAFDECITDYNAETDKHLIARAHFGTGNHVSFGKMGWPAGLRLSGYSGGYIPYPNPADNGLFLAPVIIKDNLQALRGVLPGIYATPHFNLLPHLGTIAGDDALPGRTLQLHRTTHDGGASSVFFDITGPWR